MKITSSWGRTVAVAAILLLATAGVAVAQLQTGNVYGTVSDNNGAHLPGVTVTLTGIGAPQIQVTNAEGQFRFLGLSPGTYQIKAELEGFSTVEYPNVVVNVGRNTSIELTLTPAVEEVITVTSESPLLDQRQQRNGTDVTRVELEKIPTARDPWSILNQAPGVLVDRVNVGGNESGQQSVFVGRGASSDDNAFAVDGVVITDMAAIGSSPTYYDFDSFEEVQLTTGGTDVGIATSGVTVNLVTKRGTNEWRGSGRYFLTDGTWQSNPSISKGDFGKNTVGGVNRVQSPASFKGNEIDQVEDYGAEIGGPILKDRLWIWGAGGKNMINNIVADTNFTPGKTRSHDKTELKDYNAKLNAQIVSSNSAVASWTEGDKIKTGRSAGPTRPPETTFDQSGPTDVYKLEDTQVFSSSFYLTGLWSNVDGGFALHPEGGLNADVRQGDDGVYHGSYEDFSTDRNVKQYRLDGSYFFNTGSASHELKFGGGYREAETSSLTQWPRQRISYTCGIFGCDPAGDNAAALIIRDATAGFTTKYTSAWAQDTLTVGNLTANIGLRYDDQKGENNASVVPGVNVGNVAVFPGLDFPGNNGDGFSWSTISPRLGVTYALGAERKTLLRASYSRFAEQLQQGYIARVNPLALTYAVAYFTDANGDGILENNEAGSLNILAYSGFDPANPNALSSPNKNDKNLKPATTDELNLGVEHAFLPEFVAGFNFTYRKISDIEEYQKFVVDANGATRVVNRADFVQYTTTLEGKPVFRLRPGLSFLGVGATDGLLTNGDREQEYKGGSLTFTKRLANRWMLRGSITYADFTWNVPGSYFDHQDPTNLSGSGDDDGAQVAEQSAGSGNKGSVWLNSKWSLNVNGLYQIAPDRPWGFNVAGNLSARQGYPNPLFRTVQGPDGVSRAVQVVDEIDSKRYDNVLSLDGRLDKDFDFGDFGFTVSIDGFNLLNNNVVLQRQRSVSSTQSNFIIETLSPRIFRLGLRLHWK